MLNYLVSLEIILRGGTVRIKKAAESAGVRLAEGTAGESGYSSIRINRFPINGAPEYRILNPILLIIFALQMLLSMRLKVEHLGVLGLGVEVVGSLNTLTILNASSHINMNFRHLVF